MSKHGTALSVGQFAEFSAAVLKALPRNIDPEVALDWARNGASLSGALAKALCSGADASASGLLIPRGTVSLTLAASHDPDTYYQTRKGLHVWDDYRRLVVAKAKPVDVGSKFAVNIAELALDASDKKIEDALPKSHLFDESVLCAVIAEMIAKQPNGEAGDLDNRGHVNLFYTTSCVGRVDWDCSGRVWRVNAWQRRSSACLAGSRAFSPATDA